MLAIVKVPFHIKVEHTLSSKVKQALYMKVTAVPRKLFKEVKMFIVSKTEQQNVLDVFVFLREHVFWSGFNTYPG